MTSQHMLAPSPDHRDGQSHQQELRVASADSAKRKVVTVMFVDIHRSTVISRTIELEEWWSVLAELFELMCEAVYELGGWVGNFTGDGIEALFEAGGPTYNHACRACDAAFQLRDAIRIRSDQFHSARRVKVSVRIGINSGEVITGTIGERYARYQTAAGYAIALAKRVEGLAPPDRTYLTEHTAALLASTFHLRDLGRVQVKGSELPVGVFELVGASSPVCTTTHKPTDRIPRPTQEDRKCSTFITTPEPRLR